MKRFVNQLTRSRYAAGGVLAGGLCVLAAGLVVAVAAEPDAPVVRDLDSSVAAVNEHDLSGLSLNDRRSLDEQMVQVAIKIDFAELKRLKGLIHDDPERAERVRRYVEHLSMAGATAWASAEPKKRAHYVNLAVIGQDWYRVSMNKAQHRMTPRRIADERAEREFALHRARYQMANGNAQQVAHVLEFVKSVRDKRKAIGRPPFFLPKSD